VVDGRASRSALRARWCRALAAAGACVLAAQSMQLPLLATTDRASCCCAHQAGDPDCRCPVCTHAREAQSGKPFFKTCGADRATAAVVTREPAVPVAPDALPKQVRPVPVPARIASPPPDPAPDVPTPPPLAQAS
jgi:hypothetical protein